MSLLDRKLLRDLNAMRGQVLTIALLVAAGVAVFVGSVSTYDSLRSGVDLFYAASRFPQIFVALKRAPLSIVPRLNAVVGVAAVEPRIVREVIVDWPAASQPVSARMVSLSHAGDESLSRLHLRRGAAPEPGSARSAAVNEAFAEANGVNPGDDIRVLLNGRVQSFRVSGIALSPEYVYAVKPGLPIPDDRLYAILWVDRSAAEAAFDMKGAFNDAVVSLAPGTDPKPVIAELDRLLEPYGSVGAVERRDQPSNRFLEDELNQQKVMSDHYSHHLLRRCGVPAQQRAGPAGSGPARADCRVEGFGFSNLHADDALSEARPRHRPDRIGAWHCGRLWIRTGDDRELSRLFSLARPAVQS